MASEITANQLNSIIKSINAKKAAYNTGDIPTFSTGSNTDTDVKDILEEAADGLRYTTNPYNFGKNSDPDAVFAGSQIYSGFLDYLNQVDF